MSGSILFSAIAALLSLPAYSAGPGTSAATFLNLGFGARPLALGESFVAVADDAAALHYNPAGLGFGPGLASRQSPRRYEMLASHALHIQDIRLSVPLAPWGFSVTHLALDGIRRTARIAARGHSGASDPMVGASYGKRPTDLGLGLGGTAGTSSKASGSARRRPTPWT